MSGKQRVTWTDLDSERLVLPIPPSPALLLKDKPDGHPDGHDGRARRASEPIGPALADRAQQPGLLVSPGSHTTAEFPRTPALDGPLATVNGKDGDVEREIQAMLAQQQQPTAPQLRAVSPPGPRTRHHPCACERPRDLS